MYDQFGFYRENGALPSGGTGSARGPKNVDSAVLIFRHIAAPGGEAAAPAAVGAARRRRPRRTPLVTLQDIFSQWFSRGGNAEAASAAPERGADLEYGLSIDFWQSNQLARRYG